MNQNIKADLGRRERQLMDIIYTLGEASASQVHERMADPPGFSSVRKWLFLMERKGLILSKKVGRKNIYYPAVPKKKALTKALSKLVDTFFQGSKARAVTALLQESECELTEAERDHILELIEKSKAGGR